MVLVLIGVLAVVAVPRIFNSSDYYARGFHDETLALLRYAQKSAVAQRRTVCVKFSATSPAFATLTIASDAGANVCDTALHGPNKNTKQDENCAGGASASGEPADPRACILAKPGVSYSGTLNDLSFNGLGQLAGATEAQQIQVQNSQGAISKTVTIEAETGYVHD